jgi:site-specific recombinase XerD
MLAKFDGIDLVIQAVLNTVAQSSRRVYEDTYGSWKDWCHNQGIEPLDLHPDNVLLFLRDQHVTANTRKRQLSAMRSLLQVIAMNPNAVQAKLFYDLLKISRIPTGNLSDKERSLKALNPDEVAKVLAVWSGQDNISVRNRALVALLLSTGLRRAEAVALEWRDIDLNRGILFVRHGKGDKQRSVAFVGDYAIDLLAAWKQIQNRTYVFCPLDNRGGLQADEPMTADNLYRIVKRVERNTGISLAPHDIRRTLATELLAQGASVADVQAQLGHAHPSTTLRYAQSVDAEKRRKRFKTRYGD